MKNKMCLIVFAIISITALRVISAEVATYDCYVESLGVFTWSTFGSEQSRYAAIIGNEQPLIFQFYCPQPKTNIKPFKVHEVTTIQDMESLLRESFFFYKNVEVFVKSDATRTALVLKLPLHTGYVGNEL